MKSRYVVIVTALAVLTCLGCETAEEKAAAPIPPEAVMAQRLGSEDPEERLSAEEELLRGGAASIPLLKKMLDERKVTEEGPTNAQKAAIRILGFLAESDRRARKEATDVLIGIVVDGPESLAGYAAAALKPMGESLLPRLAPRAFDDRREESRALTSLMLTIDEFATTDLLIEMLADPRARPKNVSEEQVIDALREITHRQFGYRRDDSSRERAAARQKWIDWWYRERPYIKSPLRAEEFLPENGAPGD